MATFDSIDNVRGDAICDSNATKKNKRKHKTKSLIVSTESDPNSANVDSLSLSAGCDSLTFGLRPRFSFRKFGRGRSTSKSSLPDTNSNSNSTSSIECTSIATSPSCDPNFKCPIITYNDGGDDTQLNPQIESKSWIKTHKFDKQQLEFVLRLFEKRKKKDEYASS